MKTYNKGSKKITIKTSETLRVDEELYFIIYYLNSKDIQTKGCCSGHNRYKTTIIIKDETSDKNIELFTGIEIPRSKRFYVKDKQGYYYIPEVDEEKK